MLDASLHPLDTSMVDASAVNTISAANNPPPTRAEGVPMEEDSTAQWARQSDERQSDERQSDQNNVRCFKSTGSL